MAKKTTVVKAKVTKGRQKKRMSRGYRFPWDILVVGENGFHEELLSEQTEQEAERYIRQHPELRAPMIRHTVIPPMEY